MDTEEFATSRVPPERSIVWWKIALTNVLFSLSLPTLITGLQVAQAVPRGRFLSSMLVGSLVLTAIAIPAGIVGSRSRLSTYVLARIAFGSAGSSMLNLAFALSLLGWFGVNLNLFGEAMAKLLATLTGYHGSKGIVELLAGLLMTGTTIVGLRAINRLAILIVPVLAAVTAWMFVETLKVGALTEALGRGTGNGMSFGDAVSAVVGGVVVGAVIMPDTSRFIRQPLGAVLVAIFTYFFSGAGVMIVGGLAGLATDKSDILELMLYMGLGVGAFAIVFGGSWIINALNLYSAVLSVGTATPRVSRSLLTLLCGLGGTVAAFLNILEHFLTFLFYLSIVFVPVGGIIIIDFFLARPAAYGRDDPMQVGRFEPAALVAWALGAGTAILASEGFLRLSGIAAVDAFAVGAVAHLMMSWRPGRAVVQVKP